jgi:hypothetical protein
MTDPDEMLAAIEAQGEAMVSALAKLERVVGVIEQGRERTVPYLPPLGDRGLRQLTLSTFLSAVPGLAAQFKEVPPAYVETGRGRVTVSCPCEQAPVVEHEQGCECECGRFFVASKGRVWVANGP